MLFSINGREIGCGHPPYIIAELSANHNGSLEKALQTIDAAKAAGADAIKLQTYTADTMTIDCGRDEFMIKAGPWAGYKLYELYKWAQTPFEWHEAIFEHARKIGLTVFSSPFDESAVDLLESLDVPVYKIASFEMTDLPLIRRVARTGKPIIMSTGMATEEEIEEAVMAAREAGGHALVLLHCISSYPAPIEQANLRRMIRISERFGTAPGLSDHTMGTVASVAAVSLGAVLIEKHFTLSRADKGPDSEFSLEPHELAALCQETRNAWLALGEGSFQSQQAEEGSKIFRRSVYVVKTMKAGDVVTEAHIRRIRPGYGLPPKYFDSLIGKIAKVDIERGTPASWCLFNE